MRLSGNARRTARHPARSLFIEAVAHTSLKTRPPIGRGRGLGHYWATAPPSFRLAQTFYFRGCSDMRPLTAIRAGKGRHWTFVLTLLVAAIVFGSSVGPASATTGSVDKKVQKFADLCTSQGGTLEPDPPGALICGFGSHVVSFDDLADADRLCHGQLHGDLFLNTADNFYTCEFRF